MIYSLLRPILFQFSPEKAHKITMRLLDTVASVGMGRWLLRTLYCDDNPAHRVTQFGLEFPNWVGLAAGFDKDGKHIQSLACLGFGFIEVGTVTPRPQAGNPQPRLFRLPKDKALINRMGFNNEGLDALTARLKKLRETGLHRPVIIGANIGKNKDTPNESAVDDYLTCFEALYPYADYFVVNVSSPNTPGLRALQEKEPLTRLLNTLQMANAQKPKQKPILLKIAPDLTDAELSDIAEIAQTVPLAGLIATNTTINRAGLQTESAEVEAIGAGGLSGEPMENHATQVLAKLRKILPTEFSLIGVGGIHSATDASKKRQFGADLIQIYTGFVYCGPQLIKKSILAKQKV